MEITEQQVYEAFGLGEKAQEAADPAPADTPEPTGVQEQETADPAPQQATEDGTANQPEPREPSADKPPEAPDKPELTPEQRRENAARRRQQEQQRQQEATNQAVQEALRQEREKTNTALKDLFAKAGLKNTVTGEPITNMEQFQGWSQQFEEARLQRELKAGKLTQEGLATAIGNHPIVKQAQQLVERDTAAKQAAEQTAVREKINAEIAQIHQLDAAISSLEDLVQADYWPELYAMTKRGYTIKDAHFLLNHQKLEQVKIEAAKQQAMNNARSKDHLSGTGSPRGGGSTSVPAEDLAMFRQFNPGATDAEIQAYYNKYNQR